MRLREDGPADRDVCVLGVAIAPASVQGPLIEEGEA